MDVCAHAAVGFFLGVVGLFPELLNASLQLSVWRHHTTVTGLCEPVEQIKTLLRPSREAIKINLRKKKVKSEHLCLILSPSVCPSVSYISELYHLLPDTHIGLQPQSTIFKTRTIARPMKNF